MNNLTSLARPARDFSVTLGCTTVGGDEILTHALKLQAEFNTMCAVEYLKSCDIETEIIQIALQRAIDAC